MRNTISVLFIGIYMLLAFNVNAQDEKTGSSIGPVFHKGSKTLGIAIGLGVNYNYLPNTKSLPAITVVYDQGYKDTKKGTIGIGGIVGYKGASYDYKNAAGDKAKMTNIIVAARGSYHFHISNDKLDPYIGITAGIRYTSYSDTYLDKFPLLATVKYDGVYPAIGGFAGARYAFSSKAGAFAELGYDVSFLRIGFSLGL